MTGASVIVRQLAEVQDELIALPDDAFAARSRLLQRLDELREMADNYAAGIDSQRPTENLLAELAGLRLRRGSVAKDHVGVMLQVSTTDVPRFPKPADAARTNRWMGSVPGLPRSDARMSRIKKILIDRGVEPE